MTNREIVLDYKAAKNQKFQIRILSELTLKSQEEICEILREAGCEMIFSSNGMDLSLCSEKILLMRNEGKTQKQIAEYFGVKQNVVSRLIKQAMGMQEVEEMSTAPVNEVKKWQEEANELKKENEKLKTKLKECEVRLASQLEINDSLQMQIDEMKAAGEKADEAYRELSVKCGKYATTVDVLAERFAAEKR